MGVAFIILVETLFCTQSGPRELSLLRILDIGWLKYLENQEAEKNVTHKYLYFVMLITDTL